MPFKDREKRLEYMRLYNRQYNETHKEEIRENNQHYLIKHRQENRERSHKYHLKHKEEQLEKMQIYNSTHKETLREQRRLYFLTLGQQFMDGVYGHLCFFCKEKVLVEDLARHHINGDGNEERERLGGGSTGTIRSWKQAIAEQDPMKWATSHNGCHTRFHKLEVRESHELS